MPHLEIDPFLNELNKLYEKTHAKPGTVWLTFKAKPARSKKGMTLNLIRSQPSHLYLASKDEKKPAGKEEKASEEPACLVRATDGKAKFSTTVKAKDTVRFHLALTTIMKAHMDALKKREKSKTKKKSKPTATTV